MTSPNGHTAAPTAPPTMVQFGTTICFTRSVIRDADNPGWQAAAALLIAVRLYGGDKPNYGEVQETDQIAGVGGEPAVLLTVAWCEPEDTDPNTVNGILTMLQSDLPFIHHGEPDALARKHDREAELARELQRLCVRALLDPSDG